MKLTQGAGSNFDDFLEEEGILAQSESTAIKRVIAYEIQTAMEKEKITKTEMAKRMQTSRSALDRLLNPLNKSVTLTTLESAVNAIGKRLEIKVTQKLY